MKLIAIMILSLFVTPVLAWSGQDADLGTAVMISDRDKAKPGNEIIYYDYNKEEYRTAEVTSVFGFNKTIQVQVYDVDTGKNRVFDMEK